MSLLHPQPQTLLHRLTQGRLSKLVRHFKPARFVSSPCIFVELPRSRKIEKKSSCSYRGRNWRVVSRPDIWWCFFTFFKESYHYSLFLRAHPVDYIICSITKWWTTWSSWTSACSCSWAWGWCNWWASRPSCSPARSRKAVLSPWPGCRWSCGSTCCPTTSSICAWTGASPGRPSWLGGSGWPPACW